MITYPPSLKAVGGARTGIAPVNLLDVLDVNGNLYYWSDRPFNAPVVLTGALESIADPPVPPTPGQFVAWAYPTSGAVTAASEFADAAGRVGSAGAVDVQVTITRGDPLEGAGAAYAIGGFAMPALPSGAVVDGIYAVLKLSINSLTGFFTLDGIGTIVTPGFSGSEWDGQLVALQWVPTGGLTAAEAVAATSISLKVVETAFDLNPDCGASASFAALAIYYHGGNGAPGWGFPGEAAYGSGPYIPWLVQVPAFVFHRSLVTDVGSFVVQNLSGDTLSRDFEKIARRSALEGAMFVYRLFEADAQAAWLEVHGTLSVTGVGVDTVKLKGGPLINPSQDDTPLEIYCETCQLQWGGRRCGSTEDTECSYSFQTCQVIERPMIVLNNYEKNYGEAQANTVTNAPNRRRTI